MSDERPAELPALGESGRIQAPGRSAFLPIVLLGLTLLVSTGYQTVQLAREEDALASLLAQQQQPLENSQKLRASLDAIAKQTQLLANKGNANARLIVEALNKRGVTINPDAPPVGGQPKQ